MAGKVFLTSDNHFDHSNVIRYCNRPYTSVSEMNEDMVVKWNSVVNPEDTVYHLGDFSLNVRAVEQYTPRLNGTKYLILGNHDAPHPANPKGRKVESREKYLRIYTEAGWKLVTDIANIRGRLAYHLPYLELEEDMRHAKFRLPDEGQVLLCGHVHEKWKTKRTAKGTLMVNVGVDVWDMTPVDLTVVEELIRGEEETRR